MLAAGRFLRWHEWPPRASDRPEPLRAPTRHPCCAMRPLTLILTALLLVGGAVPAAATTVLALRHGDEIIIAADSLRGLMRLGTGERSQAESCKIRNFGDLVFAHAGRFLDASWNVHLLANSLRDSREAPRQRAARFAAEVEARLRRVPRGKRQEHNLNIKFVIGFFEDGQPVLLDQTVRTIDGTIVVDPVNENPDGAVVMPGEASFLDQDPEDVAAFRKELGVSRAYYFPILSPCSISASSTRRT